MIRAYRLVKVICSFFIDERMLCVCVKTGLYRLLRLLVHRLDHLRSDNQYEPYVHVFDGFFLVSNSHSINVLIELF